MLALLDGQPGSGKSYTAVNQFVMDALLHETGRPIVSNLPIKRQALIDEAVRRTAGTRRSAVKARQAREEYDRRLIELVDGEDVVLDGQSFDPRPEAAAWMIDWGCRHEEQQVLDGTQMVRTWRHRGEGAKPRPGPMVKDRLLEFWYFTPPNSYIIFDEAADQYNNKNREKNARTTLGEYVRQHRHFKDDLLFITQNFDDLDKQFRSKFEYCYRVSNSLKENMFQTKWLQGLKWPLQFFIIRQYLRRGNRLLLENTLRMFPNRRGYSLYDSFSKPKHNFGKADLTGDERSSDYNPPLWYRVREFAKRARDLVLLSFAALVGIIMVGRMMWKMLHADSNQVASTLQLDGAKDSGPNGATKAAESATKPATGGTAETKTGEPATKGAENETKPTEPEKPKIIGMVERWVYFEGGGSKPLGALRGDELAAAVQFLGIWAERDADGLAILWTGGGSGLGAASSVAESQRPQPRQ